MLLIAVIANEQSYLIVNHLTNLPVSLISRTYYRVEIKTKQKLALNRLLLLVGKSRILIETPSVNLKNKHVHFYYLLAKGSRQIKMQLQLSYHTSLKFDSNKTLTSFKTLYRLMWIHSICQ